MCAAVLAAAHVASADVGPSEGVRIGVIPGASLEFLNANSVTGGGGKLWAGYELLRGPWGLTPLGELGYYDFPRDPNGQLFFATAGFKVGYHFGEWIPSATASAGYARTWLASTTPSITTSYVALSIGAELSHQITDWLAIGIDFDYRPLVSTSAPATKTILDFGASATISL